MLSLTTLYRFYYKDREIINNDLSKKCLPKEKSLLTKKYFGDMFAPKIIGLAINI